MKAYGCNTKKFRQVAKCPDAADLIALGKTNRKAANRKAARRVFKKTARRIAKTEILNI